MVLVLTLVLIARASAFDWNIFDGLEQIENVQINHKTYHNRRRSPTTTHPDIIYTTIVLGNQTRVITFKRSDVEHMPGIFEQKDGERELHTEYVDPCTRFYLSNDDFAHALVNSCNTEGESMHVTVAEIVMNGDVHVMLPTYSRTTQTLYNLFKVKQLKSLDDNAEINHGYMKDDMARMTRSRRKAGTPIVEVLLFIDYSLYISWYGKTSGSGIERETETINTVTKFYAFFAQAVDLRFSGLAVYNIFLDIKVTAVYILKTSADSYFTENADFSSSSRGVLDVENLLASFRSWLDNQQGADSSFPLADHYMLLTGRDVSLQGNRASAGYAYIDSICTSNSVSVVEDTFDFLSITIASHEIGHALNGVHDSLVEGCSDDDGYILSAANQAFTDSRATHPWQFSSCSADAFKRKMDALNANQSMNCLLYDNWSQDILAAGSPPGQVFGPDQQCRFALGYESFMIRRLHAREFEKLCTGMWCTGLSVSIAKLIIPAEGTSCGNKKWCWNGACTFSMDAPEVDESCLYGDQPGEYKPGSTCSYSVQTDLGSCYMETVGASCCRSCKAAQLNISDCLYGDRSSCGTIKAAQCYEASVEKECCKTCFNYAQNYLHIPGCKYGDLYVNCAPANCDKYPQECCRTCYSSMERTISSLVTTRYVSTVKQQTAVVTPSATKPPTTTQESTRGQGMEEQKKLPRWVIPVAAGGGGVVAVMATIIIVAFCCCNRNKAKQYTETKIDDGQHLGNHRKRSRELRRESGEKRRKSDERHKYDERRGYAHRFSLDETGGNKSMKPKGRKYSMDPGYYNHGFARNNY